MGISFGTDIITLTDGDYSLNDLYNACTDGSVSKLGSMYQVDKSIFVGNKNGTGAASLVDKQITLTLNGEWFQVHTGSYIKFGEKRANGTTANGCTLLMDNLDLYYGFGGGANTDGNGRDPDVTGDCYLYGCTVNAWCFWSWFGGEHQKVEIIDCLVDGFGRIQGETSILKNITIEKSHGRYGVLSPKGSLAVLENISVGATDGSDSKAAVYFNPKYAPDMEIIGGTYKGYEKLVYTEKLEGTLTFVDSVIEGNMLRDTKDDLSTVLWQNTFNPVCMDNSGNLLEGVTLTISDNTGVEHFSGVSGTDGTCTTRLTKFRHIGAESNPIEDLNPYTIVGVYDDGLGNEDSLIEFTRLLTVSEPMWNMPFYISNGGAVGEATVSCPEVDYDRIQEMIDANNCVPTTVDYGRIEGMLPDMSKQASLIRSKLDDIEQDIQGNHTTVITEVTRLSTRTVDLRHRVKGIGREVSTSNKYGKDNNLKIASLFKQLSSNGSRGGL